VRAALLRYRVMAYVTGVMLIILRFVGAPLQIAGHAAVADIVGDLHGFLYLVYLVFAWLLARRLHLTLGPTVLLLLAGTIPILTFVEGRWLTHRYIEPTLARQDTAQPKMAKPPSR
jgi:integral membrane protein